MTDSIDHFPYSGVINNIRYLFQLIHLDWYYDEQKSHVPFKKTICEILTDKRPGAHARNMRIKFARFRSKSKNDFELVTRQNWPLRDWIEFGKNKEEN